MGLCARRRQPHGGGEVPALQEEVRSVLVCARERPGRAKNDRREKGAWKPLGSVFLLHDPDLEPSQMALAEQ